jgi:hypothetical protein
VDSTPQGRSARRLSPKATRWTGLFLGGLLAYVLGGPLGFMAACLFVFIMRLLQAPQRDT